MYALRHLMTTDSQAPPAPWLRLGAKGVEPAREGRSLFLTLEHAKMALRYVLEHDRALCGKSVAIEAVPEEEAPYRGQFVVHLMEGGTTEHRYLRLDEDGVVVLATVNRAMVFGDEGSAEAGRALAAAKTRTPIDAFQITDVSKPERTTAAA